MKVKQSFLKAFLPFAGALISVLPSCNRLELEESSISEPQEITIVADFEMTKTANNGNSTVWVADDAISAIHCEAGTQQYSADRFVYKGNNEFRGGDARTLANTNNWYLVYPYRQGNVDPANVSITVAATQTQTGDNNKLHFAGEGFPLYGKEIGIPKTAGIQISMQQVMAALQLEFANTCTYPVIVKEIVFSGSNPVSGDFKMDLTVDNITLTESGVTSNSATLKVEGASAVAASGSAVYNLGIAPCTTDQFKLKVTAVKADDPSQEVVFYHVYSRSNGFSFLPGHISRVAVSFDDQHSVDPDGAKEAQTISFSAEEVNWTLGGTYQIGESYAPQSVGGANTPVTYSSSNADVATIVDNQIVIKGIGSTIITADAAEDDFYYSASASYTLNIAQGTVQPAGYEQITTEPSDWSGEYLLVSSDKAFLFTGDNGTSNKVTLSASDFNGNVITRSGLDDYTFTISKSGNNYYLKHNNQYLYCSYSGSGTSGNSSTGLGYSSTQQALSLEMLSDGNFSFHMTEGSTDQHLYYKTADNSNYFKFGGNYGGKGVLLYKYSEGGVTPGPVDPTTQSFVKVTSTPTSWDGTYLVVDENSGRAMAISGSTVSTVNVTISGGAIAATDQLVSAALTFADAGVKHANNNQYEAYTVQTSEGKYIYYSNSQLVVADTPSKNDGGTNYYYYHTFMLDNNGVQMMSGRHSSGSNKYYLRYSNGFGYNSTSSNRVQLYKLSGSVTPPTKEDQVLSFPNEEVNWTVGSTRQIGSSYNPQSPSGAVTTVTYTSSNTAVATIDNGKILLVGTGTTTITATAAADDTHNAGSASYTLNITQEQTTVTGYEQITTEPSDWSGEYLLVSSDKAFLFTGDNGTSNKVALSASDFTGNVITRSGLSGYTFTISKSGNNYYLKHNNQYLYCSYSGSGTSGDSSTGLGYSSTQQALSLQMLSDGNFSFHMTENSTDQHLYYKTADNSNYFKFGGNYGGKGVLLYKYTESGVTPGPDQPDGPTGDYEKITTEPSSWNGTYLVVDETARKAFMPFAENAPNFAIDVTINNGVITANTDLSKYAITITDAGSNHSNSHLSGQRAYDVKNTEGYYVYWSSDFGATDSYIHVKPTNQASNEGTTYTYHHAFKVIDGGVQLVSAIDTDGGNAYYLGYSNGAFNYTEDSSRRVQLYKLDGSVTPPTPGKQNQTLSFSTSSVNWTLGSTYRVGGSYAIQTLSGAKTTVTYSSSNTSVATISNGQIRIVAAGSTTITANAASDATYNAGSASYTLNISAAPSSPEGYEQITTEPSDWSGDYLLVSSDKAFLFTGDNGTSNKVTLSSSDFNGNVITRSGLDDYTFTISKSGNNYYLKHNNQYLYCSYSGSGTSGNSSTGLGYSSTQQALSLQMLSDGNFSFHMTENSTDQHLYYKTADNSNYFKFGGNYGGKGVLLYKYNEGSQPGKQNQTLSFANSSVNWVIGSTYKVGSSYAIQTLSGAKTTVTYSSSNTSVATITSGQIRIAGTGTTTITANAASDATYNAGSASYTLVITQEGAYNLENSALRQYLDDAEASYTDSNSNSVMSKYLSGKSASNRLDFPAPVTLTWTASSGSGEYTVSVYNNSSRSNLEMSQTSTTTSADIYNLIPNRTYYYTVTRGSTTVKTGSFSTTGRRRMMRVSDTYANGHANNCRDLGGMTTTDGKTLKYNLVFRGTNMDATTTAEKQYLTGYMNIKTDVDLRAGTSSSYYGDNGSSSGYNALSDYSVTWSHTGYNSFSDLSNASKTKTTFTDIINCVKAGNACFIHCYVGADRTGYICMLLEAVLGVSAKDCSIDYELTSFSCVGNRFRDGTGDVYFRQGLQYINNYSGSTFKQKAENILLNAGITSQQITDLRNAMLQ